MPAKQRFDEWPQRYDRWFETPVGRAVQRYETGMVLEMLQPAPGERILDAGCGTGIFTREFVARGARVVGLDISLAMLRFGAGKPPVRADAAGAWPGLAPARSRAGADTAGYLPVLADMTALPFADGAFDKSVSVAALEFVADEKQAVRELFRVTRPGGVVVVATLNSRSPWAARRSEQARRDPGSIFNQVFFRSPAELLAAAAVPGRVETAIHFGKGDDPASFDRSEREGRGRESGAFVAARWEKPR